MRATKIKTPYVSGAARAEYRGFDEGRSIGYPQADERFLSFTIQTAGLDIALHRTRYELIDLKALGNPVAHLGR